VSDSAHGNELAASHFVAARNGLENHEARFVAKGLRYFLDLVFVHKSSGTGGLAPLSQMQPATQLDATDYLDIHLSTEASNRQLEGQESFGALNQKRHGG
jgi:hypothetical protein